MYYSKTAEAIAAIALALGFAILWWQALAMGM